jgi:crossover junction endodeoxyribonuclease RuvC
MKRLFVGIDCGLNGAIGIVRADGSFYCCEDMPIQARGSGRVKHEVCATELLRLLQPHAGEVSFGLVEKAAARPGQGVASMFSLGHSTGVVDGVLAALNVAHATIPAATWKKRAGLPADKALVLAAARRRWPHAPLTRVRDHGRGEALYLALLAVNAACGCESGPLASERPAAGPALPAGARDAADGVLA